VGSHGGSDTDPETDESGTIFFGGRQWLIIEILI